VVERVPATIIRFEGNRAGIVDAAVLRRIFQRAARNASISTDIPTATVSH
jgi:hypothetical protein